MDNKEIFWRLFQNLKAIALHIFLIYDLVEVVAKILVHFHLPRGDHHQNVKTTFTS